MDLLLDAAAIDLVGKSSQGVKIVEQFEVINDAFNDITEPWAQKEREDLRRDAMRASVTPMVGSAMKDKLVEIRLPKALLDLELITREEFREVVKYIRFGN